MGKPRPRERKESSQDPMVSKTGLVNRLHLTGQLWSVGNACLTVRRALGLYLGAVGKNAGLSESCCPGRGWNGIAGIGVTAEDDERNALAFLASLRLLPKKFGDVYRRWFQSKSKGRKRQKSDV